MISDHLLDNEQDSKVVCDKASLRCDQPSWADESLWKGGMFWYRHFFKDGVCVDCGVNETEKP